MASIVKYPKGYRVQIDTKGVRASKTFRTLREAQAWAAAEETKIHANHQKAPAQKFSFLQALEKYRDEVAPKKRGSRAELVRVGRMLHSPHIDLSKAIGDIDETDIAQFRDKRLKEVSPGTVLREIALLSALFSIAKTEWKWITRSPVKDVKKPPKPKHRDRIISGVEIRKMLRSMDYKGHSITSMAADVFLLCLMTGMRQNEACALRLDQDKGSYLSGVGTKTTPRDVPLSKPARRLLDRVKPKTGDRFFDLSANTLEALFRRHRERLGLSGFTFHDSRHTAATRIAKKVHVLTLCKIFGWENTSQALTYYNPSAADISKQL